MSNPDISRCVGTDCKKKETCLRYTLPAREKNQSWIHMKISIKDVDNCKYYWEMK